MKISVVTKRFCGHKEVLLVKEVAVTQQQADIAPGLPAPSPLPSEIRTTLEKGCHDVSQCCRKGAHHVVGGNIVTDNTHTVKEEQQGLPIRVLSCS